MMRIRMLWELHGAYREGRDWSRPVCSAEITMDLTITHHHSCFPAVMWTAIAVLFFAIRDTTGPTTTVTTTVTTAVTAAANAAVSLAGSFFPHLAALI